MKTNQWLRKRCLRLVDDLGVNQKVLAAKLGIPPSTFSKWLREKVKTSISIDALDGLRAYEQEFLAAIETTEETRRETPEAEHAPAAASAAVDRFRQSRAKTASPPHGVLRKRSK